MLTVSVTHKPAEEMAARYFFNPSQKAALTELLAPEFDTLWTGVLSGMISDGGDLVAVAHSQVETSAESCIGAGTGLNPLWNGAPVSFPGAPISAAILTPDCS